MHGPAAFLEPLLGMIGAQAALMVQIICAMAYIISGFVLAAVFIVTLIKLSYMFKDEEMVHLAVFDKAILAMDVTSIEKIARDVLRVDVKLDMFEPVSGVTAAMYIRYTASSSKESSRKAAQFEAAVLAFLEEETSKAHKNTGYIKPSFMVYVHS